MDIKSWILLVGTVLIVAVICHGFWTAYRARKNDVRMEIEADIPQDDLDEMVLLRGELPNGGARVTPTVGFEALRMKDRQVVSDEDALIDLPLDEVAAFAQEGAFDASAASQGIAPDEGNFDAGYEPEQTSLDLAVDDNGVGLEERYAARVAAELDESASAQAAPLLVDATLTPRDERASEVSAPQPRKKLIATQDQPLPRKQFEPPLPEEVAAQELAVQELAKVRAQERAEEEAQAAARAKAEERAEELALVAEKSRLRRAQAAEAEARAVEARALEQARLAQEQAAKEAQAAAKLEEARIAEQAKQREQQQAEAGRIERLDREKRIRAETRKALEAPEQPQLAFAQDEPVRGNKSRGAREHTAEAGAGGGEELVVLNVIAKTSAFQGGDVLELFLRNGIKFGDMNIFHRIDPVTKASQYSIASLTEPGYFDLRTMDAMQIKGLCLFMQLPGPGQPTKVFTDMLTVADKLARQLDAEVCDEQFNRLTRQSTEHYRQRVAEFSRRQMAKRALV